MRLSEFYRDINYGASSENYWGVVALIHYAGRSFGLSKRQCVVEDVWVEE